VVGIPTLLLIKYDTECIRLLTTLVSLINIAISLPGEIKPNPP